MLQLEPLKGSKEIISDGRKIGEIIDFWSWSFSSLYVPIPRGFYAEYLVFKSIHDGSDDLFRPPLNYLSTKLEKDEPDVITYLGNDKMTIQVKSIDSIKKGQFFKIAKTHKYNRETDEDDGSKGHQCNLFVFCFLKLNSTMHKKIDDYRKIGCKTKEEEEDQCHRLQNHLINAILNMSNWAFYICSSSILQNQESIRVSKLEKLVVDGKVTKCNYSNLHASIKTYHTLKFFDPKCF